MTHKLVIAILAFATAAHAQAPVGLLSLVSGDAQIVRSGQQAAAPARTADLLAPGDRIVTGTKGEVTFLFCPQSKTAKVGPNSEIEFAAGAYTVKKGAVSAEKQVPSCRLPSTLTLSSASKVQSGMLRLRGDLVMRSPVNTSIATLRPRFWWEPMRRARSYELRVRDREEHILWRTDLSGTEAEYPAEATPLAWGQKFYWRLTARDDAGEQLESAEKPFQVLAADQAQEVHLAEDSLRAMVEQNPSDNWPRFLLAFLYEERGMFDEAAKVYYELDQRGTQPWVEGRLTELMNKLGWDEKTLKNAAAH